MQVPEEVKNRRSQELMRRAEETAGNFYLNCRGAVRMALLEEETEEGLLTGYTDNYIKVYVSGERAAELILQYKTLSEYKDGMKGEIENG